MNDEAPDGRMTQDPSVDPGLRSLLEGMRADVPDPAHVERLVAGSRARASMPSSWPKWAMLGGLAVLLCGALYALRPAPSGPPVPTAAVPEQSIAARTAEVPASAPPPVLEVEPAPPAPPPAPRPPRAERVRNVPPALEPSPEVEPAAVEAPSPAPVEAPSPQDELALLAAARRALRADAPRALTLVDEHEARFPSSAFAEERAVLRFDALLRTGRRDEAARAADALLRRWPSSVHRHHIEESLAAP